MEDTIGKKAELKAPVERVWKALTDHKEFGEWFGVRIDGPFVVGQLSTGNITYPGYEHVKWEATVTKMERPRFFSYTWHPYAIDPNIDYSTEPVTLVEFTLEPTKTGGTLLTVKESGFAKIPAGRRPEAFRKNTAGWEGQLESIAEYVHGKA